MKIYPMDIKAQMKPIRKEIDSAIRDVIDSGSFILGAEVGRLEQDIAKYCRVKYVIGVANGTDAISLSLRAFGIGHGDGVICPTFTYYATAGAIAYVGARPIFVDIDPKTYNISVDSIKKILKQKSKHKIKAIIPVHLYGQCADMDPIMRIAKKYKLKVIEDAAQSFGAVYRGRRAGTIGDCGTVSFYPAKNLGAFGDAGCILTNNKALAEKLCSLRNQGTSPKDRYEHLYVGGNTRLDSIQAAVLRIKLKCIETWNKKRAKCADYYNKELSNTNLTLPFVPNYNSHIFNQYMLRTKKNKERIRKYLIKKGVDSRTFYSIPLHLQPCFKYLGYKKGDFPESEHCAKETFVIPIYPEIKKNQMDYVIKSLKKAIG